MTTAPEPQTDIVDMLLDDHRRAEQLFARFDVQMDLRQRDELFRELATALVQHEVAEEETVYPALRNLSPAAAAEADARLAEQAEAEVLLRSMEQQDALSPDFVAAFGQLHRAVLRHAQSEESEVFPLLRRAFALDDRVRMGSRYGHARDHAPTHPHPRVPDTPPGNVLIGPIAALGDRVRDAFRSVPGDGSAQMSAPD